MLAFETVEEQMQTTRINQTMRTASSPQSSLPSPLLLFFLHSSPTCACSSDQGGSRSEDDPNSQGQPFVNREMAGNERNQFHQGHRGPDSQPEPHHRSLACRKIHHSRLGACEGHARRTSGRPSNRAGNGPDLGDRNQDPIPKQQTSRGGEANTKDRDRRCPVTCVDRSGARIHHVTTSQGKQ